MVTEGGGRRADACHIVMCDCVTTTNSLVRSEKLNIRSSAVGGGCFEASTLECGTLSRLPSGSDNVYF